MVTPETRAGYAQIRKYDPAQSLLSLPFTTPGTVHKRLAKLRYTGYTYEQISALDEFSEIPPGTLQVMYESAGDYIPQKHRHFLRCRAERPRHRASINLDDMASAAQTIVSNIGEDRPRMWALIDFLHTYMMCGNIEDGW